MMMREWTLKGEMLTQHAFPCGKEAAIQTTRHTEPLVRRKQLGHNTASFATAFKRTTRQLFLTV